MWKVLSKLSDNIEEDQFWKAVDVWNQNPHTVNRRIHSCVTILVAELEDFDFSCLLNVKLENTDLSAEDLFKTFQSIGLKIYPNNSGRQQQVFVKKLLPRNNAYFKESLELVILDKPNISAYFCSLASEKEANLIPKFPYRISLNSAIQIEVPISQSTTDPSAIWLQTHLLSNLGKWSHSTEAASLKSHTLISKEKYATLYQALKKKYGQEMIKIWPECTDPVKFIHEDVAIASYLMLLWDSDAPVSFIDLGCGNGLLVHILNSEGHKGLGIDVRERKIWKLYPDTTKLEVKSITPSDSALFPEVEWLIGNHSDELTPWIPVIAARSSQSCKFFVLPCCPYDFDGLRYRRRNSILSPYSDFLEYMQQVSEGCGFKTYIDRLRIPSTKRICIVGKERGYCDGEWSNVNNNIVKLIERGCRKTERLSEVSDSWVEDFKPREPKEVVRNCTHLERGLINEIVNLVANFLLVKRRMLLVNNKSSKPWNAGGIATIGELVPLIAVDKLKKLKSECGGLQTLLRNNHQVFLVEKGKVQLRPPISKADVTKNGKIVMKYKPCWYFHNHPDGCMLSDQDCAFLHS